MMLSLNNIRAPLMMLTRRRAVNAVLLCRSASSSSSSSAYFASTRQQSTSVTGVSRDHGIDVGTAFRGQRVTPPYELTVGSTWRDLWFSNFYALDRIFTSSNFARKLGFKDVLMAPDLLTFMTGSMTHIDSSKQVMDIGYSNALYERPVYAGDTLSKQFHIKDLRETSDGEGTVMTVDCEIFNLDTNERVFRVDKTMLFPNVVPSVEASFSRIDNSTQHTQQSKILDQVLRKHHILPPPIHLKVLSASQLLLHSVCRPIGQSNSINLSTLFRMTHPLLHNLTRYRTNEIIVAGGLVMAAAHACSSKALHEVLFERVISCSFQNKVLPTDSIGAMTYVLNVKQLGGALEEVTVRTIGTKQIDVVDELNEHSLPKELFTSSDWRPKQYEELCEQQCRELKGKIVMQSLRKIVRQTPRDMEPVFLL